VNIIMRSKKHKKPMPRRKNRKSPKSHSMAKISGRFDGNITAQGELHIAQGATCRANIRANCVNVDGKFEGQMSAKGGMWIRGKGQCKGKLMANSMRVDGMVEGEAFVADTMKLSNHSQMKGNIVANCVGFADGASFDGRCTIGKFAAPQTRRAKAA